MLNSVPPAPGAPVSDLDIYDPEFAADPYPHMACMRDMGAVVFLEKAGVWAVPRYADVRTVLADHDTFISSAGAGLSNNFKEPPRRPVPTPLLEADPPAHSHDRAIIQRVLSGPALRKLRDAFFAEADRLIAPLVRTGAFDAVTDLAEIFATFISPTALGFDFSPADRERVLYLSSVAFVFFGPKNDYFHQTMRQAPEHLAWVTERCRREHILPGSIGAQIYAAADEGAITEAHAALLVRSVLLASLDNTIAGLGRFLKLLATHPDQWRLIVANPELSRAAFEEMMRFDQPSVP